MEKKPRFKVPANWPNPGTPTDIQKPEPPDPAKMSQAEKWLRSVPKIPHSDSMKLCVEIEMSSNDWFFLATGAAANGLTLEQAIYFLLIQRNDNLSDWSNEEWKLNDEYTDDDDDDDKEKDPA